MTQVKRNDTPDGYLWRCPKHKGRTKSIRTGSFIEKSKLTLRQFVPVIYAWSLNASGRMAAVMTGLAEKTGSTFARMYACIGQEETPG